MEDVPRFEHVVPLLEILCVCGEPAASVVMPPITRSDPDALSDWEGGPVLPLSRAGKNKLGSKKW